MGGRRRCKRRRGDQHGETNSGTLQRATPAERWKGGLLCSGHDRCSADLEGSKTSSDRLQQPRSASLAARRSPLRTQLHPSLRVDEKSQIQALDREQPVLPMMLGIPERRTHSYVRHGTTSLFAALHIASGFVIGKCYKRHRATEFLDFLKQIDRAVPDGLDVHIVMDNYATHKTAKVRAWLARRPHYHVHFTPTSASWINQIERWFAELTRKQLQRGVHRSTAQLEADIRTFIDRHNDNPKPFKWTKSADEILASVKRFCQKSDRTLCSEL